MCLLVVYNSLFISCERIVPLIVLDDCLSIFAFLQVNHTKLCFWYHSLASQPSTSSPTLIPTHLTPRAPSDSVSPRRRPLPFPPYTDSTSPSRRLASPPSPHPYNCAQSVPPFRCKDSVGAAARLLHSAASAPEKQRDTAPLRGVPFHPGCEFGLPDLDFSRSCYGRGRSRVAAVGGCPPDPSGSSCATPHCRCSSHRSSSDRSWPR
jgi:hypothetical protein